MPEPIYDQKNKLLKKNSQGKPPEGEKELSTNPLAELQQQVGNRAVGHLLQRSGTGGTVLDEETSASIHAARGSGQNLDEDVQESMGQAMNHDFSDVRVHTSSESDQLNRQLGAEAFTTGKDVFFKEGNYDPDTPSGQELLAHELTHVVQQGTGQTGGGAMTVNAPGDEFEQQADSVAESVVAGGMDASVQRQPEEEEEEMLMPKLDVQRQPEEEEEEMLMPKLDLQRQEEEEEEEEIMPKLDVQRQPIYPEEEIIEP